MARFEIPEGWTAQAFQFTLDPTVEQAACVRLDTLRPLKGISVSWSLG